MFAVAVLVCGRLTAAYPLAASSPPHADDDRQQPQAYDYEQPEHGGSDSDAAPRTYHFQYAVHDPVTGDVKSQNEVGDGHGGVRGSYSLVEPDGSTRVVEYAADDAHGFTAEVKKIEPQHKAETAEYEIIDQSAASLYAGDEGFGQSAGHRYGDGASDQSAGHRYGDEPQSTTKNDDEPTTDGSSSELYSPR